MLLVSQQCLLSDTTLPRKSVFMHTNNTLCGHSNTLPFTDATYQSLLSYLSISDLCYLLHFNVAYFMSQLFLSRCVIHRKHWSSAI